MLEFDILTPGIKGGVASVFGSMISTRFMPGMTKWQKFTAALSGVAMAYFISEAVAAHFENDGFVGIVGFLTGLFGINVCEKIFIYINTDFVKDIRTRIRK